MANTNTAVNFHSIQFVSVPGIFEIIRGKMEHDIVQPTYSEITVIAKIFQIPIPSFTFFMQFGTTFDEINKKHQQI